MANKTRTALRNELKAQYLEVLKDFFGQSEDVLVIKSNAIAFPVLDSEGNEDFITVTVSVPTGSRDDGEPWDGYAEAEAYQMKIKEKEEKARLKKEESEKKKAERERKKEEKKALKETEKEGS